MHTIHTQAVRKSCKNFYTPKQISAWLKNRSPEGYLKAIKNGDMFVVENNNIVVAFGHAIAGEIVGIFVDPKSHKKGVGKMLLEYALKIASENAKTVKVDASLNAEKFYEKYGFVKKSDSFVVRNGEQLPIVIMERSVE